MDENCHVEPIQKTVTAAERQNLETAFLAGWGLGCVNCATRVRNRQRPFSLVKVIGYE